MAQPGSHADTDCHTNCLQFVDRLDNSKERIAVDDGYLIFSEYFRLLSQQLAPHDALIRLMAQGRVVEMHVKVDDEGVVLPDELAGIVHDRDDRKFVAVSLACSPPAPIVNATDSDWVDWEECLRDHGVEVIQLCPEVVHAPRDSAERRA